MQKQLIKSQSSSAYTDTVSFTQVHFASSKRLRSQNDTEKQSFGSQSDAIECDSDRSQEESKDMTLEVGSQERFMPKKPQQP